MMYSTFTDGVDDDPDNIALRENRFVLPAVAAAGDGCTGAVAAGCAGCGCGCCAATGCGVARNRSLSSKTCSHISNPGPLTVSRQRRRPERICRSPRRIQTRAHPARRLDDHYHIHMAQSTLAVCTCSSASTTCATVDAWLGRRACRRSDSSFILRNGMLRKVYSCLRPKPVAAWRRAGAVAHNSSRSTRCSVRIQAASA